MDRDVNGAETFSFVSAPDSKKHFIRCNKSEITETKEKTYLPAGGPTLTGLLTTKCAKYAV